ncbi:MAG: hypothetical protein RL338_1238 [Chloroflexota bacterium]
MDERGGPTDRITLAAPGVAVELDPASGGRIARLRLDGLELIKPDGYGPIEWGAYPMVPWAGRLRDGILRFRGETHRLPLSLPPHAIHGTTWTLPWSVVEATPDEATMAIELEPPWPFGGRALHRVAVEARGLRSTIEIHAGERPMPAIVGWHPWFPRRLAAGGPAELVLRAGGMLRRGPDGIPTGEVVPPSAGPWDDAFVDVTQPVLVRWPGAVELAISAPESAWWVCYTERDDAICVEPQTGPPNGLSTGEHAVVEPGRPLVATMTIAWRRRF